MIQRRSVSEWCLGALSVVLVLLWGCGDSPEGTLCDPGAERWSCPGDALPLEPDAFRQSFDVWPGAGREASGWPRALDPVDADRDTRFSLLVANLGNIDIFGCRDVDFNLCRLDAAMAIRDEVARMRPEVVLLSEVLTLEQCEDRGVPDADHFCSVLLAAEGRDAVEGAVWLLGPDYDIACDARSGFECIGVLRDRFVLEDCGDAQGWCGRILTTPDAAEGCDEGFTASSALLRRGALRFEVWNAHPQSGAREQDQRCRASDLRAALMTRDEGGMRTLDLALFGGDMNMDPARGQAGQVDFDLWDDQIDWRGEPRRWRMHSGPAERFPPWATSVTGTVLDHMLSTGFAGRCTTLGAEPGFPPLDLDVPSRDARLDHLALYCLLSPP